VRNYTPVETPTPAPTAILPTLTPTDTLTPTPFPTPTPLPVNPAVLTQADISTSLVYGGLGAVILIIILGIYFGLRRN
jgi:carbohydrate-binding DOMON domain-containing protein